MEVKTIKNLRPLLFLNDGSHILCSRGYKLYLLDSSSLKKRYLTKFNVGFKGFLSNFATISRVLRLGFSSAVTIDNDLILLTDKKEFFIYSLNRNSIRVCKELSEFIPPLTLNIGYESDTLYYGEYTRVGSDKVPSIYSINRDLEVKRVVTFPKDAIDHIHYIDYQKSKNRLLILTGDFKRDVGVWIYEFDTKRLYPKYCNGQESRYCWIYSTKDGYFCATDSLLKRNYFKFISSNFSKIKNLFEINGSSIYSCKKDDDIIFSSTVEPGMPSGKFFKDLLNIKRGEGILSDYSEIVTANSSKGSIEKKTKKDFWPFKLGQFGVFTFPNDKNSTNFIFAYAIALKGYNNRLIRIKDRD